MATRIIKKASAAKRGPGKWLKKLKKKITGTSSSYSRAAKKAKCPKKGQCKKVRGKHKTGIDRFR